MTLTEQWKKGELEWGKNYYCRNVKTNETNICFLYGSTWYSADSDGEGDIDWQGYLEVLAPVPSYEEWQNINEFADYSIHNRDELTRQINFWMDKHTQIEKENQQLKELLKESAAYVKSVVMVANDCKEYEVAKKHNKLFMDICEAIGEKK